MSEYRRNVKKVQDAVDMRCAVLRPDPYLAQRVMLAAECERGRTVRRKISLGLIMALILMLLTATAVALVALSGKDMVSQVVAPLVHLTTDETWSDEEINMIIQLADENGIELPNGINERIRQSDPVYKEELMRLLMKADYGESPALWPIEEQAWYDELLVQVGLCSERTRFMPENGEISEDDALKTAITYASEEWSADLEDEATYRAYRQYMLTEDAEGNLCKRWNIEFEMENGVTYVISVTPEGEVDEYAFATYIHAPQTLQTVEKKLPGDIRELADLMRDDAFYTVETLADFRSTYGELIAQTEDASNPELQLMRMIMEIPYQLPGAQDIAPEKAFALAEAAARSTGWTDEWLGWCHYSISYRAYEGEAPVYRVCWKLLPENRALFYKREMPFGVVVYLNPANGETLQCVTLDELDDFDRWCEFPDAHDTVTRPGVG